VNIHQNEVRLIIRALEETGGNRTEAAKKLGISRRTLHRRLKELQLPE
jgi:DNA-binding NtrC family response regulator